MLIRKPADLRYSDVTPKQVYVNRRRFLAGSLAMGAFGALAGTARAGMKLTDVKKTSYNVGDEKLTPLEIITHYNNYYEFGTDKGDPAENATELPHLALDAEGGRRSGQAEDFRPGRFVQDRSARRAHLPASLRGKHGPLSCRGSAFR